jgi:hypothetical protein
MSATTKIADIFEEVLAHFLTDFAVNEPPRRLELYVTQFLRATYSPTIIDDFLAHSLNRLQDCLVTEYNERSSAAASLRYSFADDDGEVVQGIGGLAQADKIAFQDGLNLLTPAEFEAFSAHLLRLASCSRVWKTQETHDEGLDSFGYMPYFRIHNKWVGGSPEVVFLAQAKHYNDCKVGSRDIREFVGSSRLAALKIYSKIDERYGDLEIRPFAPVALVFVTTQEVPRTVKHMARAAGIVVLTSDDLFPIFLSSVATLPNPIASTWVAQEIRNVCNDIPKAK